MSKRWHNSILHKHVTLRLPSVNVNNNNNNIIVMVHYRSGTLDSILWVLILEDNFFSICNAKEETKQKTLQRGIH